MKLFAIVNLTPDSFSDGGYISDDNLLPVCHNLLNQGADVLDFGAQSTRPNATPISEDEEIHRLKHFLPLIDKLDCLKSIDTFHPNTALLALKHNFHFVNCVFSAALPDIIPISKKFTAYTVVTFDKPLNSISDILVFFRFYLYNFQKIICDPGIGFNKSQSQNALILENLHNLSTVDGNLIPTLLGVSRKSVLGYLTGNDINHRDFDSAACALLAYLAGFTYCRVHNVELTQNFLKVVRALNLSPAGLSASHSSSSSTTPTLQENSGLSTV